MNRPQGAINVYSPIRVHVEFMDGEKRTYEQVGGFLISPSFGGEGKKAVTLEMVFKGGPAALTTHVASLPLVNVREYRVEPMR